MQASVVTGSEIHNRKEMQIVMKIEFSTENVKIVGTAMILARTENVVHLAALPVLESHLHALKNFPAEEQRLFST